MYGEKIIYVKFFCISVYAKKTVNFNCNARDFSTKQVYTNKKMNLLNIVDWNHIYHIDIYNTLLTLLIVMRVRPFLFEVWVPRCDLWVPFFGQIFWNFWNFLLTISRIVFELKDNISLRLLSALINAISILELKIFFFLL